MMLMQQLIPVGNFSTSKFKARLIAAALHELGMSDILDSRRGEFSQPDLHEASNMEKKEYVRKIATRIVDGYVIRRENVQNIFNNLLAAEAAEEEEVRQQTENGKYICFFSLVVAKPLHQVENECMNMKPPITNRSRLKIPKGYSSQVTQHLHTKSLKRMICSIIRRVLC